MVTQYRPRSEPLVASPVAVRRWASVASVLATPRNMVLVGLLLTYIWRYHDMAPPLQPLRLAAIATVASWILLVLAARVSLLKAAIGTPYVALAITWLLWTALTVIGALDANLAWEAWWSGQTKTLTMMLFVVTCLTSIDSIRAVYAVHALGAATLTFFYTKGGYPLWGSPVPMYDVNDLALHLNIALPMVLFLALSVKARVVSMGLWALALLMAVSILMTQSRGGLLTLGTTVVIIWLRFRGVKWWVRVVPPVALIGGFFLLPTAAQERLSMLFSPTEDYNYSEDFGRVETWKRGMNYLAQYPVMGVGIANFPVAEATISPRALAGEWAPARVAHSSVAEVAVETGVPGISMYLLMLIFAFVRLNRLRKRLGSAPETLREVGLMADVLWLSLLAFSVGGLFLSMGYAPILFSLIALLAGLEYNTNKLLQSS
jgi:probable O-glycosylation ligase (exosortase A-associated)